MSKRHGLSSLDFFAGKKLRDFRERLGWSQAKLAEMIGVSPQQVHKYEQGYSKISLHLLYKLTQIFNVTFNSFFEGFKPSFLEHLNKNVAPSAHKEILCILLVEDSPADEFMVRKALVSIASKVDIYCLRTYEEVSKFLKRKVTVSPFPRPDIILLNFKSQKTNGLTILKSLKQDRTTQAIPVIVLNTTLERQDVMDAYQNHASGYINKSLDFEVFQKNLQQAIKYWSETVILPDGFPIKLADAEPIDN